MSDDVKPFSAQELNNVKERNAPGHIDTEDLARLYVTAKAGLDAQADRLLLDQETTLTHKSGAAMTLTWRQIITNCNGAARHTGTPNQEEQ